MGDAAPYIYIYIRSMLNFGDGTDAKKAQPGKKIPYTPLSCGTIVGSGRFPRLTATAMETGSKPR